ncbi:diuretic hormone receptor [Ixodes scapularis]|uniref:diuretic hormone receptor n=1 Tax=Ixodes scapularis TaxID=6945 RepID=UPI001C3942D6|nr:diuretic hormone receptor [Ixodes scapularis]
MLMLPLPSDCADESGPLPCQRKWDGLSCWPVTSPGTVAVLPCFSFLNDLFYDTSNNVTRTCLENGTWADRSDYSSCRPLIDVDREVDETTLYYIGYGVSLCALTIALWIFLYYKDLRCLRNTIHVNLMVTYFLISLVWMTTATLQSIPSPPYHKAACFLYIVLTYLMGTNFFWMFVEGLYLYILVVKTFSIELVRFHVYAFIGWGLPAVVVAVWAATKAIFSPNHNDPVLSDGICVWQLKDIYDCIFICPVVIVLLVNIFFMGEIMWVLITKLRAATTLETQQYRKAAKALLVLIPLLGVTYILVIWTPSHKTARIIFTYLQITLLSTQGFTVAVLYCFFNGEVRSTIRHHLERWRASRALRAERLRTGLSYRVGCRQASQERVAQQNETTRLYKGRAPRASCASFASTTSTVAPQGSFLTAGHRLVNGAYGPAKDDAV